MAIAMIIIGWIGTILGLGGTFLGFITYDEASANFHEILSMSEWEWNLQHSNAGWGGGYDINLSHAKDAMETGRIIMIIGIIILIIAIALLICGYIMRSKKKRNSTPQAFTKMCPRCKAVCDIRQNFCNNCGHNLMQANFNPNQQRQQQTPQQGHQNPQQRQQ